MLDRMSESMRDDECTMSVHRAVASKSDDERKAVAGMSDDVNVRRSRAKGSILERMQGVL